MRDGQEGWEGLGYKCDRCPKAHRATRLFYPAILPRLFLMADWGEFPNLFLHFKIGVKVREMAW